MNFFGVITSQCGGRAKWVKCLRGGIARIEEKAARAFRENRLNHNLKFMLLFLPFNGPLMHWIAKVAEKPQGATKAATSSRRPYVSTDGH